MCRIVKEKWIEIFVLVCKLVTNLLTVVSDISMTKPDKLKRSSTHSQKQILRM